MKWIIKHVGKFYVGKYYILSVIKLEAGNMDVHSGHNVIKLFTSVIYKFYTKLECLVDEAWKASQGQTI